MEEQEQKQKIQWTGMWQTSIIRIDMFESRFDCIKEFDREAIKFIADKFAQGCTDITRILTLGS
jgi:hypothetical protein